MNPSPPDHKPGTYVSHIQTSGTPVGPPASPEPPKRKLSIGFFILGFFTPWLVAALTAMVSMPLFGEYGAVSSFVGVALPGVTFLAQLAAWVIGRSNGNEPLRSWGLGGMATAALQALGVLLLFGACAIGLATY